MTRPRSIILASFMALVSLLACSDILAANITLQDGSAPGNTATQYNSTVDTYIDRLQPDTSMNQNATTITVNADQTMWLQFGNLQNILPPDSAVTAVTVELTVVSFVGASTFDVYTVDPSKAASGANMTYNKFGTGATQFWELPGAQGATDRSASIGSLSSASIVGGKLTFTIPVATVEGWIVNANNNRGILIQNEMAAIGDYIEFAAENYGTTLDRPAISITWTSESFYWFYSGGSPNFTNNNSWSETDIYRIPKGASPNAATHRVYFSNTNSGAGTNANCNIQPYGNLEFYLLQTRNGYTGNWSNTNRSFTVGDGGFFIDSAMTYNHGSGNITVSGNMRVGSGANFTMSNPATVVVAGTFTLQTNNTQFIINGNGGITCGNYDQNNNSTMRIQGGGSIITTVGTIDISGGTFEMQTGFVSADTSMSISGNTSFSMQNGTITAPGNPGLSISGSATITKGNGTITANDLRISSSNPVNFTNETITIADEVHITGTAGPPTVNFNNSTLTVGDFFLTNNSAVVNLNNCPVTINNDIDIRSNSIFNMGGALVTVADDVILRNNGTFNMNTGALVVGDDLSMSDDCTFNMTDASLTITDNITMSGGTYNAHPGTDLFIGEHFNMSGGLFVAPPAGQVMWVGGNFNQTAGVFQNNNGLVKMQPLGAPYNSPNSNVTLASLQSLWDLEINRTNSNDDVTLSNVVNIDNDIIISDGEYRMASHTMYLGGDWIRNTIDTAFFPQTGTVVFDEAQSITLTELDPFYNVEIAKAGGHSVTLGIDHDIDNNFIITSGTYDVSASNYYVIVSGSIIQTGGTFVQRQGWVVLDGADQSPALTNMTFYGLAAAGTGVKGFTGNLTIEAFVTVRAGVTLSFSSGVCTALTTTCFTNQSGTMSFQDGVLPTAAYSGTSDTWLNVNSQGTNYGNANDVPVDGDPDQGGLFKWSIRELPPGSTVSGASMQFTLFDPTPDTYEIYRVRRRWVESEATWLNANATTPWATGGAANTATDRENIILGTMPQNVTGTFTIALAADIYPFIQAWADIPENNTGFTIQDYSVSNGVDIRSSEYGTAAQRPRFNVDYQTIQGTIRIGPGGRVVVPDGTSVVQGTSATWEFTGTDSLTPAARASLESNNPGVAKWSMSIPAGATFRAYGARFVDGNITVADNVTELTIADAAFENLPAGTTNYLDISAVTTGTVNFRRMAFDRGSNVGIAIAKNIRASATTVPVTVGGYSGNLGGEVFDDDPLNRIRWANNQERYEVVHSTLGTSYAYSLPAALANLPTAPQTLTIRGQYVSVTTVVTAFNQHNGTLVLPDFAGILNIDGFKFVTHNAASGIMLDLGAKTTGTVNVYNCAFVDTANGGTARAFVVPPAGAAVVNVRFSTANSTAAASGVDGTNTNNIYTLSLTAPQRASRFVDHDNGDYHLTRDGIQNGGWAVTRDGTFIRDLDGRTRTAGASQSFQGCYHAAVNAVATVAVKDLETGTTGSTNQEFIYTSIPVNNTLGQVAYLAGATATTVRLSAMNRTNFVVAPGNTLTWAGYLAGHVSVRQCSDDTTKYWLYLPYDSTGDGYFNAIRKVLHNVTAQTLTDSGNLTILNRAGGAIDFTSNGGWSGQLQFTNEFTGGPADEAQVGILTPAGGGQVHTWYLNANSASGNFFRTADFQDANIAAESYVGGAGFDLNPRLDSVPMLGGSPSGGKLWLTRTADANNAVFIQFTRQNSASTINNVTIDNSVAGGAAGSSFSTTPFQLFRADGRRLGVRSDTARIVSLKHQTMGTNNLDVGGLAGFGGATGTPPVGFFNTLQLFVGMYNPTTGRGAVIATEYAPQQDGDTNQELLNTSYTAQSSKLIYSDNTSTNGSFTQAIAPVMGSPTRLAHAPTPATNTVVFCGTDAGLLYAWEAAGIPASSHTGRKGRLLPGFPIQFTGGRITAMTFLSLSDATLLSQLNLTVTTNVLSCTTDSGQVVLVRVPNVP